MAFSFNLAAFVFFLALMAHGENRIIGGTQASGHNDITSRVILLKTEFFSPTMGKLKGTCSGVLLSPKVVLTAGHCVKSVADDAVLRKMTINAGSTEINARRWVASPEYKKIAGPSPNDDVVPVVDLAIVELENAAPAAAVVSKLPSADVPAKDQQLFVIAGFGQSDPDNKVAGTLNFALTLGRPIVVADGLDQQILIEGAQACHGDSGGPVYLPENGEYVLVGIISNGKPDCRGGTKAMSVFHHLAWIQKMLERLVQ